MFVAHQTASGWVQQGFFELSATCWEKVEPHPFAWVRLLI